MPENALPVAVIGAGGFGQQVLQAIRELSGVRLVGLSDADGETVRHAANEFGAPGYLDNRSLLAETRPEVVLFAAPPRCAGEVISACAERGIHIWKAAPLARNLEEAGAFVRQTDRAGVKCAVGAHWRWAAGYRHARELLDGISPLFMARAHYLFNWGHELGWRNDQGSAGGGALLEIGWHPIDLMVWLLGLPENVFGHVTIARPAERPGERVSAPYDTEDNAVSVLRYDRDLTAALAVSRRSGPVSEQLSLHGRGGSIVADAAECTHRDTDGNILDRLADEAPMSAVLARQIQAFARAVTANSPVYTGSAGESLLTQSVVEAIYLSQRTGQPEQPRQLLGRHGIDEEFCYVRKPAEPA